MASVASHERRGKGGKKQEEKGILALSQIQNVYLPLRCLGKGEKWEEGKFQEVTNNFYGVGGQLHISDKMLVPEIGLVYESDFPQLERRKNTFLDYLNKKKMWRNLRRRLSVSALVEEETSKGGKG